MEFSILDHLASIAKHKAKQKALTVRNTETLINALKTMGSTEMSVEFNGCGDNGTIESIEIDNFKDTTIPWLQSNSSKDIPVVTERKVSEVIESHIEAIIYHHTKVDWVNNEGGQGTITIDLEDESIDIHIGENHTATTWHDYLI